MTTDLAAGTAIRIHGSLAQGRIIARRRGFLVWKPNASDPHNEDIVLEGPIFTRDQVGQYQVRFHGPGGETTMFIREHEFTVNA